MLTRNPSTRITTPILVGASLLIASTSAAQFTFDPAANQIVGTQPSGAASADFNGDGVVDVQDLLILLSEWGTCAGCASDLNGDGQVDVTDLLALLAAWTV